LERTAFLQTWHKAGWTISERIRWAQFDNDEVDHDRSAVRGRSAGHANLIALLGFMAGITIAFAWEYPSNDSNDGLSSSARRMMIHATPNRL
jgi:hypothetical protein